MTERTIAGGLTVHPTTDRLAFRFPGGTGVCFDRKGHRASASLLFAGNSFKVDVSLQPSTIVLEVDQAARDEGIDPNRWRVAVLQELRQWWPDLQWCQPEARMLMSAVGAVTHPVLAHVYRAGRQPIGEVPRWATDVLRSATPQQAAETLAPDATRRLVKVLAESLLGSDNDGPTSLGPLAVASVGRALCSADELANLLAVPSAAGPDRLPSVDELDTARRAVGLYPVARRAALLDDTAQHHDVRTLAEVGLHLWWVRDRVERPLPVRLQELRDRCRRHVHVLADQPSQAAAPAAATRPAPARTVGAAIAHQPTAPALGDGPLIRPRTAPTAFGAPRVSTPGRTPNRWPVPQGLLPVHQLRHEGLSYTVPTSRNELATWGAILRNCLGDFGRAAATQTSWLIGIEQHDRLIGCVEVDPATRRVRQALGPRNHPLPEVVHRTTITLLQRHGIIH
ncbi:MAG: PcfJ-like protein [Actinomycetota bacterium]